MSIKGTYALLLHSETSQTVAVGALGTRSFPPGWYIYVGSAHGPGGLEARLARHQRRAEKRFHWHIDYVRAVTTLVEVWTGTSKVRRECEWASAAAALPGAIVITPGLGASDCHCPSHLFHYTQRPKHGAFEALIQTELEREQIDDVASCEVRRAELSEKLLDELISVLLDKAATDERREQAALALKDLGGDALPSLRNLLESKDPEHRWWAARALAAIGGPTSTSILIKTLSDNDPDVRVCAALGLGILAAPEAVSPLIRLLADDSAYVGRIASNALASIGQPAVPALIEALSNKSSAARACAARALIPLESHEAIPALFSALDDESALVTHYAEEALWRMGVGLVLIKP